MNKEGNYLFKKIFGEKYPIEEITKGCLEKDAFDLNRKIYFNLYRKKVYLASSYDLLPTERKVELSTEAIDFYESTGLIIPPNTIFKNIYLVPAGFKYSYKVNDFYLVDKLKVNKFNTIEMLEQIIISKYNFNKANLLMSGGADSTLLLLLLHKNQPSIKVNSIIFKSGKIDKDLIRARRICKDLNSSLIELDSKKSKEEEVKNFLIKQTEKLKEPIYEPLLFTYGEILKNTKDCNIIFDGQGADSILGGLGHHHLVSIYKNKFVRFFSSLGLFNFLLFGFKFIKVKNRFLYRIFKLIISLKENSLEECLISSLYSSKKKFIKNNFLKLNIEIIKMYSNKYDDVATVSLLFLCIISARELQKYKVDDNYIYCLPFLEKEFIHYCLSLPKEYKVKGKKRKIQIIDYLNAYFPNSFSSSQQLPFEPNSSHVLYSKNDIFQDPLVKSKNIRAISIAKLESILNKINYKYLK